MAAASPTYFPGMEPTTKEVSFLPVNGRESPAIWVKSLAVYTDWKPSGTTLLRRFELRRGLNILWAMPEGKGADPRLSGHGAGKSTFCRVLRYLLGEDSAGPSEFTDNFRRKFRTGWVLGEVMVADKPWLVGRTLSAGGYGHFAYPNCDRSFEFPERPPRHGFDDYREALEQAAFANLPERHLPDSRATLNWQRLLPWLSRDQEAHYRGLLEWRHQDSEHGSPNPSHDDRGHIVRLILGVLNPEEQSLLEKLARASESHERLVRERPQQQSILENDRKRLALSLGIEVTTPNDPLLDAAVRNRVNELKRRVDLGPIKERQKTEIAALQEQADAARSRWRLAEAMMTELEEKVRLEEARVAGSPPPAPPPKKKDAALDFIGDLGPFPGYCSHEMNSAWRSRCPIAHERPEDEKEFKEAVETIGGDDKEGAKLALARLKANLEQRQKGVAERKAVFDRTSSSLTAIRERHQTELEEASAPQKVADSLQTLFDSYVQSSSDLEAWDKEIEQHAREKRRTTEKLETLAEQHTGTVESFEAIFHFVVRQIVAEHATGKVEFRGKAIQPDLYYKGKRNSAALKVAKWLAFDLAAMLFGVTHPKAHHPRILIHDSPREADLAKGIYAELFRTVHQLETKCGTNAGGFAPFQYIVTTTEPPPDSLTREPWLIQPKLDASTEEGRLLGINLET